MVVLEVKVEVEVEGEGKVEVELEVEVERKDQLRRSNESRRLQTRRIDAMHCR